MYIQEHLESSIFTDYASICSIFVIHCKNATIDVIVRRSLPHVEKWLRTIGAVRKEVVYKHGHIVASIVQCITVRKCVRSYHRRYHRHHRRYHRHYHRRYHRHYHYRRRLHHHHVHHLNSYWITSMA